MRKSLLFIALCTLAFSCTEDFPENQSAQESTTSSLKIMSFYYNNRNDENKRSVRDINSKFLRCHYRREKLPKRISS
jgi:hypothetical protein